MPAVTYNKKIVSKELVEGSDGNHREFSYVKR